MKDLELLSLFSGCGGLDLGFEDAGFVVPLALDSSKKAVESYNRNRRSSPALVCDLSAATAADLGRLWKEVSGSSPVGVIGGPPCQAFSRGNYRQHDGDLRRLLPRTYADLLAGLVSQFPTIRFFVFENVTGLLAARHSEYVRDLLGRFSRAGFNYLHVLKLDAADFGVPQHRQRVFLVGLRESQERFVPPQAAGAARKTVRQAIAHLPEPVTFAETKKGAGGARFHLNHWCMTPRSPRFVDNEDTPGSAVGRSFRRLRWDAPSWTVSYGHREVHVHPSGHRRLSVFEAMLLQGFPEHYELDGSLTDQFRMVSDAVAPPVAEAVAGSVKDWLERQSTSNGHSGQRGRRGLQTSAPRSTRA